MMFCLIVCDSTRERMKLPYMNDQCELMLKISSEFVRLQVSHDEYLCMKVLLLLSTGQSSEPSDVRLQHTVRHAVSVNVPLLTRLCVDEM